MSEIGAKNSLQYPSISDSKINKVNKTEENHLSLPKLSINAEATPVNKSDTGNFISSTGKAHANFPMDFKFDAKLFVDSIRSSQGEKRDMMLIGFKDKLDNLSTGELRNVRDYLTNAISDPVNKDDKFLGTLLRVVNQELDSRDKFTPPGPSIRDVIIKPDIKFD